MFGPIVATTADGRDKKKKKKKKVYIRVSCLPEDIACDIVDVILHGSFVWPVHDPENCTAINNYCFWSGS